MSYSKGTIQALQTAVNAAGYTPALVVDGIVGPKTTAGVAWLQQTSSYSITNGTIDNQFLANLGIDPTSANPQPAVAAQTTVQKPAQGGGGTLFFGPPAQNTPQPVYQPPPPLPLNVRPPPQVNPYTPPPPPAPTPPKPSPVAAKTSPIPAAVGGAAGAGLGWFAVGGPIAALIGGAAGAVGGWLFGKKTTASMGCEAEMSAETTPVPTTRYFTATCTQLARTPASYYRYAPRAIITALSAWCASIMHLPPNAIAATIYKLGRWEARRSGQNVTLYGPPYHEAGAMFGAEWNAEFGSGAGAGRGHSHAAHRKPAPPRQPAPPRR